MQSGVGGVALGGLARASERDLAPVQGQGQGQGQGNALWIDRTRRLAAPLPAPEGDLGPNTTGWLLGVGDEGDRFYPRLSRLARGLCGLAAIGPAWVALFDLAPDLLNSAAVGAAPVLFFFNAARLRFHWSLRQASDETTPLRGNLT